MLDMVWRNVELNWNMNLYLPRKVQEKEAAFTQTKQS
jgi:hypothetical protein